MAYDYDDDYDDDYRRSDHYEQVLEMGDDVSNTLTSDDYDDGDGGDAII